MDSHIFSPLINELITAFRCLPSVGPKSAQRMVFHLLERDRSGGRELSNLLTKAMNNIINCESCRNFTESKICKICANPNRDQSKLCIVKTPADVFAMENTFNYKGLYFVLLGELSPIDGIGPEDLGLELFEEKLSTGLIEEVIMATNSTIEGEATAFYFSEITKKYKEHNIVTTKLAHGIPLGGELEYVDPGTLSKAFSSRILITA